jgi:hypothetical protein
MSHRVLSDGVMFIEQLRGILDEHCCDLDAL